MNTEIVKGFFIGGMMVMLFVLFFYIVYTKVFSSNKKNSISEESVVIANSIENISKLMLVESTFSEIYTYKENEKTFFNLIPIEKKAILVLKAKVMVGYDLKKMKYNIDKEEKKVTIIEIPEQEIIINPDIQFYDIQTSTFTTFGKEDYNKLSDLAKKKIENSIENSNIKIQAHQNLIQSLESVFNVAKALNWKVIDDSKKLPIIEKSILN